MTLLLLRTQILRAGYVHSGSAERPSSLLSLPGQDHQTPASQAAGLESPRQVHRGCSGVKHGALIHTAEECISARYQCPGQSLRNVRVEAMAEVETKGMQAKQFSEAKYGLMRQNNVCKHVATGGRTIRHMKSEQQGCTPGDNVVLLCRVLQ